MKISKIEFIPVSVPYTHREVSSLINRDGATADPYLWLTDLETGIW